MRKCNLQFAGQQRNFHHARRLYFQIVLFITHTDTHTLTYTQAHSHTHGHSHTQTCVFLLLLWNRQQIERTNVWMTMWVWERVCVCVWERPFVSMIMRRVNQLTFYSFTSTRLGPTLTLHLCLGFVFISLNWNSIKSGSCKSYDISHCRVQGNTKDYNYGYISAQMQSWEW